MLTVDDIAAYETIDRHALWALRAEIDLYPKAGLVSRIDNGSHTDMDAATFDVSAIALKGYFAEISEAAAKGADFAVLNRIGRKAEAAMFVATGGINTHRGAVFSLGLLAAAAGLCRTRDEAPCPYRICRAVERWGRPILASHPQRDESHGALVRTAYGAPGAREEAAAGFPTLCFHVLPAFGDMIERGGSIDAAALQGYYTAVSTLQDNNILYRAGPDGLSWAKDLANGFLERGGMISTGGIELAEGVHRAFVSRNISPGGSADLLIACLFLAVEGGMVEP